MKLSLPAALLAVTLPGSALLGSAGAQTLVPFKDAKVKLPFAVSLPQGWLGINFNDGTGGVSLVSAKTAPATLIRLLFVPKNGDPGNIAEQFAGYEAGVKQSGGTLKQLSSRSARYGGVGGIEREYALTHKQGNLRLRIWFGNGAKNLYSFQVTDTPERYAGSSALFSKILATVRF